MNLKKHTKSPIKNPLKTYAGKSADERIHQLADNLLPWFGMTALFICLSITEAIEPNIQPHILYLTTLIILTSTIYKTTKTRKRIKRTIQGKEGELEIAEYLDNALRDLLTGKPIRTFHDIPSDGFNIDHILICDRGIYVIETKTISKPLKGNQELFYNGGAQIYIRRNNKKYKLPGNHIEQTKQNANWLKKYLREQYDKQGLKYPDFYIKGVVLYPGQYINDKQAPKRNTWVLNPKAFASFLSKQPIQLDKEQIFAIANELYKLIRQ